MESTYKEQLNTLLVPVHFSDENMWYNKALGSVKQIRVGWRRWGTNDPMYKRTIRLMGDATRAYEKEKFTCFAKAGLLSYKGIIPGVAAGQRCESTDFPVADPWSGRAPSGWVVQQAQMRAAVSALGKIRELQTSFSGFTILGEMHKTIHQLKHPFEALRKEMNIFQQKYYRTVRGKEFLTPSLRKAISNTWLEFTLAVQPTLNDVFQVLDAANQIPFTKLHRIEASGYGEEAFRDPAGYNCGGYMVWGYTDETRTRVTCKFVCGVLERDETDRGPLHRAKARGEFTLAGVAPAAWELLPWSFVLDYWANLGHIMEAVAASTRDLSFSSRTTVSIVDREFKDWVADYRFDRGYYVEDETSFPDSYARKTAIVRDGARPVVYDPIAAVKLRLPPHIKQVANMVALFDQSLCSKARFRFR